MSLNKLFTSVKSLLSFLPPKRKFHLFSILLLMVVTSFAEIVTLGALIPFLSAVVQPEILFNNEHLKILIYFFSITHPDQILFPLTFLFILAAIISGILRFSLLFFQIKLGNLMGADISFIIYKSTLFKNYAHHLTKNSSEVIAGITNKSDGVVSIIILPILNLISSFFLLTTILITLILINPLVSLSTFLIIGIIYLIIIFYSKKKLFDNSQIYSSLLTKRIKVLQEGLGGIRDVILDSLQNVFTNIYKDIDLSLRNANASSQIIANSPKFIIEALGISLIATITYFLISIDNNLENTIPTIGALAFGAQRMLPILQQFYSNVSSIRSGEKILDDILDLLVTNKINYVNEENFERLSFHKQIMLDNICFKYQENSPFVLKDINIKIKKGSRIGFIGKTGAGKSTLFDIIMGLLEPSSGKFYVDNTLINASNAKSWRLNVAHVPQTIFLSDASISENIAFGVPKNLINMKLVREVAKIAQIDDLISGWNEGYDTNVGERGNNLSGGQRQRIGIARALYKKSNILIFDESTNALDSFTEMNLIKAIENMDKKITILIIAHRQTTLKFCDLVYSLEDKHLKREYLID